MRDFTIPIKKEDYLTSKGQKKAWRDMPRESNTKPSFLDKKGKRKKIKKLDRQK